MIRVLIPFFHPGTLRGRAILMERPDPSGLGARGDGLGRGYVVGTGLHPRYGYNYNGKGRGIGEGEIYGVKTSSGLV